MGTNAVGGVTIRGGGSRPLLVVLVPRPMLPSLRDSTGRSVPGRPVARPAGLLTAPRPRNGARRWETPPCLCVSWEGRTILLQGTMGSCSPCSHLCKRAVARWWGSGGGGMVAHLIAPQLVAFRVVCAAPGPGREAGVPDTEPTGERPGLATSASRGQATRLLHNCLTGTGRAVVHGTTPRDSRCGLG